MVIDEFIKKCVVKLLVEMCRRFIEISIDELLHFDFESFHTCDYTHIKSYDRVHTTKCYE
jgi:imidazole glycerol phosphate synthase subunit HisF